MAVACQFNSLAGGQSGGLGETEGEQDAGSGSPSDTGAPTGGATDAMTSVNPSDPSDPSDPSNPSDPSDPSDTSTDTMGGSGGVELTDGHDFGPVDIGTTVLHTFTLTNNGDEDATGIAFDLAAGPFSITDNGCARSLGPDESCDIEVTFAPTDLGPTSMPLTVGFTAGPGPDEIERTLEGGGAGSTENLIANPSSEMCNGASLPQQWSLSIGSNWVCENDFAGVTPLAGSWYFFPGAAAMGDPVTLNQRIDLPSDVAKLVATSDLGMHFSGWESSNTNGDDPHRYRIEFYDDTSAYIEEWASDWTSGPAGWNEVTETRVPDADTYAVVVYLECNLAVSTNCSAMFDDLSLTFFYPPP